MIVVARSSIPSDAASIQLRTPEVFISLIRRWAPTHPVQLRHRPARHHVVAGTGWGAGVTTVSSASAGGDAGSGIGCRVFARYAASGTHMTSWTTRIAATAPRIAGLLLKAIPMAA